MFSWLIIHNCKNYIYHCLPNSYWKLETRLKKKGTYFLAIFPCQIVKFTKFSVKQAKRISSSHVLFSCFMLLKHKENVDNRSQASRFNKFIHFRAGWKREKSWVRFCWKILIRISLSKTGFFVVWGGGESKHGS